MISRFAGTVSVVLTLLSLAIVWRSAASPDSDWLSGLIPAAPFFILGATLAGLAYSTKRQASASK